MSESAIEAKWGDTQQKCYVAEQESLSGVKWSEMQRKYSTPTTRTGVSIELSGGNRERKSREEQKSTS